MLRLIDIVTFEKVNEKSSITYITIFFYQNHTDEVYSIKHYVIKFVSDLWQVGDFHRFPLPIQLTATKYLKYC